MIILAFQSDVCLLPSPEWSNTHTPQSLVDIKRFKSGGHSVFVSTYNLVELIFTVNLTEYQSQQFQDFYKLYAGQKIILIWKDKSYQGGLPPLSLTHDRRSADEYNEENVSVTFTFIGTPDA